MRKALAFLSLSLVALSFSCLAQEQVGVVDQIANFPSKFFSRLQSKSSDLDARLTKQTDKYLSKLARQEAKLRAKWMRQDSAAASRFFANNPINYTALQQMLRNGTARPSTLQLPSTSGSVYIPNLDSLKTSLKFLQQNGQLLSSATQASAQVGAALTQVNQLQNKVQLAAQIQNLIRQRKDQLRQALGRYTNLSGALQNSFKGYSQQAYYYGAQMQVYREELSNPDKLSREAFSILGKQAAYQRFMQTHSDIAGLFGVPGGSTGMLTGIGGLGSAPAKPLPGLQTREQVNQILHVSLASGGPNASQAVSQQVSLAQTQLRNLKSKIAGLGGGNSNMDIPDFRPNGQHVKSFLHRLTYGFNIQSAPSTFYFPTTSDIGASLGYRLSDCNTVGIGASYKMGWGQDIKHIVISSQGVGLRSFLDVRIKGSLFATGGLEYNYQQPIYSYNQIEHLSDWTRSGLIGITKKYKISSRMQGSLQLLWDFLSYEQVPRTAPVVFRLGYAF